MGTYAYRLTIFRCFKHAMSIVIAEMLASFENLHVSCTRTLKQQHDQKQPRDRNNPLQDHPFRMR
jgi:hypothetical protein